MSAKTILCIIRRIHVQSCMARDAGRSLRFDAPPERDGARAGATGASDARRRAGRDRDRVAPDRALQTALRALRRPSGEAPMLVTHLARECVENSCDVGRSPALLAAEISVDGRPRTSMTCGGTRRAKRTGAASASSRSRPSTPAWRNSGRSCSSVLSGVIAVSPIPRSSFHLTGRELANCEVATLKLESTGLWRDAATTTST